MSRARELLKQLKEASGSSLPKLTNLGATWFSKFKKKYPKLGYIKNDNLIVVYKENGDHFLTFDLSSGNVMSDLTKQDLLNLVSN